ncbi:hypothetical protein V6U90_01460 [Micromonospora sp. CPCC 206060]|uniref:hypothetical protein n=1 Tax=Micromonospora sp. CPCC 206060 TaxID=3122406 RepID=UPI002FEEB667
MRLSGFAQPGSDPGPPPAGTTRLRLLVTTRAVLARPGPAGEAGYVTGLSVLPGVPPWWWLVLSGLDAFRPECGFDPYDLVTVDVTRAGAGPTRAGAESTEARWPVPGTVRREHHLKQWALRRAWLDGHVEESMCRLDRPDRQPAPALVRVRDVAELLITPASGGIPGPTGGHPRPRFRGAYRWRCAGRTCPGHRHDIVDWEFTALQRRVVGLPDDRLRAALVNTFHGRLCAPDREVAFYVGPAGPGRPGYAVTGVYWPPKP